MKTPEGIKKGLELIGCDDIVEFLKAADKGIDYDCNEDVAKDALAYIQQLESRLAQVEQERDALMMDLQTATYRGRSFNLDCEFCKDKDKPICEDCQWQWRGPCPENTKEG